MANGGNFAVWDSLTVGTRSNLLNGALTVDATSTDLAGVNTTIGITTGKWYWELYVTKGAGGGGGYMYVGLNPGYEGGGEYYQGYGHLNGMVGGSIRWENNGDLQDDSSSDDPDRWGTVTLVSTGMSTYADGDILQVALDYDNKKVWFGKNGTFINSGNPATGTNQQASWDGTVPIIYPNAQPYATGNDFTLNAGQDPTFAGRKSTGSADAADSNSRGSFYYTPPTNYLALCSGNLPASTDIDPAETSDAYPSKNFNIVTYTGNASTNAISGLGFQPDLVFIKRRDATATYSSALVDSVRGRAKAYYSHSNAVEATSSSTNDLISFDSDGFTLGTNDNIDANGNTDTYVAWCWKAGGTASTDSTGTITVSRSTNNASKFTIATWTGNGTSGATIPHGLGVKPTMTWIKKLDATSATNVWHQGFDSGDPDSFGELLGTAAWYANQGVNGPYTTAPGTEFLTLTAYGQVNGSTNSYVGYFWADVEGMQKFSTYNGNGNAFGPFVYTGFRPRLIFIKKSSGTGHWVALDTKRGGATGTVELTNPLRKAVDWDAVTAEYGTGTRDVEAVSNGFKIRTSDAELNASGSKYVWGAWGDVPFKYGNTI